MGGGQFVDEAAGHLALPLAIDPAVGSEGNRAQRLGPGDADIGEAAFLLQPLGAAFVHAALAREQPVFPARQEHRRKLQPLGGVQGHDRDLVHRFLGVIFHDQRDMLQKALQRLKLLQRLDQFLEVFEPPRRFRRLVGLPHAGVAGLVKDHFGQFDMALPRAQHRRVPAVHPVAKAAQLAGTLATDAAGCQQPARALQQRHAIGARRALDIGLRLVAKAAFWQVHHPFKGQIILGRHREAEIGHRVADLGAFVETRPADDAVGQADGQEAVLEGPHLVAGADEDGHVFKAHHRQAAPSGLQRLDLVADPAGFFLAIPMADQPQLFAALGRRPQRLAQTAGIGGDHPRRRREDMRGGAVILFQPHHLRAGKIRLEAQDVANLGPAPAIDRLIVIADAADVAMRLRQQPQPQVLGNVGVLIFIDQNVAEPALILRQHIGMLLKDHHAMQQKVAEIHGVQGAQTVLIGLVKLGSAHVIGMGLGRGHAVGGQGAVFPGINHSGQQPRGPAFFVDIGGGDQLLQQAQLVVGVKDGEAGFQPDQFGMAAQDFDAQRMKGAHPGHAFGHLAQHPPDPQLHLARRLVGEGHRQDLVRAGAAHGQQVNDAGGQCLGLAGAGARQHQHRAVQRLHRRPLRRVQIVEIGGRPGRHGALRQGQALRGFKGVGVVPCAHQHSLARI